MNSVAEFKFGNAILLYEQHQYRCFHYAYFCAYILSLCFAKHIPCNGGTYQGCDWLSLRFFDQSHHIIHLTSIRLWFQDAVNTPRLLYFPNDMGNRNLDDEDWLGDKCTNSREESGIKQQLRNAFTKIFPAMLEYYYGL